MFLDHKDLEWIEVLLEDFDRARSLSIAICLRYNEWDTLVSFKCDPSDYCDFNRESFRLDYQATEILRKNVDLPVSADASQAALDSFWAAEEQCARTNRRLKAFNTARESNILFKGKWGEYDFLMAARKKVTKILGQLPEDLIPKFSSGSTFNDKRHILPMDKMSTRPTVTQDAYTVIEPLWRHTAWCHSLCVERSNYSLPRTVLGNRYTSVPKTALTERGICIEPSLNITYQLPVGSYIRKRLRLNGIDLLHGQSLHQRLMKDASLTRELGTIDLSSASDTVAYELVRMLLPDEWFELLNSLRSHQTYISGAWHKNAKFSSMGNGFTFELESLIFYALALVTRDYTVKADGLKNPFYFDRNPLVYGDDIIVPVYYAPKLIKVLEFCGFITNLRKTWVNDHAFRESCGSDYFNGVLVRGHYLEQFPNDPIGWIKLANGIRRMASHDLYHFNDLDRYKRCWLRVISRIPTAYRVRGPVHYGDTVIHDCESRWQRKTDEFGTEFIRTISEQFSAADKTNYNRKFWTAGSIVSAALLGKLTGLGDEHNDYRSPGSYQYFDGRLGRTRYVAPKPFVLPRSTSSGFKVGWAVLYTCPTNHPSWLKHRDYGYVGTSSNY